jgi:hypothetical protein
MGSGGRLAYANSETSDIIHRKIRFVKRILKIISKMAILHTVSASKKKILLKMRMC